MTTQTRGDWKTNFAISFLWKWKCYFFKRKSFFPFSFSSACYVVLSLSFLFLGPACARFPANLVNFIFLSFPFLGSPIDLFPNRETCQQPRDIFPFFGQKVSFSDLPPKEREKDLSRVTSFFCRLKVKPFSFFLFCRFFRLRGKEELCLAVKMPNVVWLFVSPPPFLTEAATTSITKARKKANMWKCLQKEKIRKRKRSPPPLQCLITNQSLSIFVSWNMILRYLPFSLIINTEVSSSCFFSHVYI